VASERKTVDTLRERLLCGIDPAALDPLVLALVESTAKLVGALKDKTPGEVSKMSVADLSKALMNCQKALDGVARLRSFVAGGPDSRPEPPTFIMELVAPDEPAKVDGEA